MSIQWLEEWEHVDKTDGKNISRNRYKTVCLTLDDHMAPETMQFSMHGATRSNKQINCTTSGFKKEGGHSDSKDCIFVPFFGHFLCAGNTLI